MEEEKSTPSTENKGTEKRGSKEKKSGYDKVA